MRTLLRRTWTGHETRTSDRGLTESIKGPRNRTVLMDPVLAALLVISFGFGGAGAAACWMVVGGEAAYLYNVVAVV